MNRRGLIAGLGVLLCTPAVIRVADLMPISVVKPKFVWHVVEEDAWHDAIIHEYRRLERLGLVENSDLFSEVLVVDKTWDMTISKVGGAGQHFDTHIRGVLT